MSSISHTEERRPATGTSTKDIVLAVAGSHCTGAKSADTIVFECNGLIATWMCTRYRGADEDAVAEKGDLSKVCCKVTTC